MLVREMACGVELPLRREGAELDRFLRGIVSVLERVLERHMQRDGSGHHGRKQPGKGDSGGEESAGVHEWAILTASAAAVNSGAGLGHSLPSRSELRFRFEDWRQYAGR